MTMRLTVDSSVFISALNPNDPFVEISQKFFSSIAKKGSKIIIPITIALEVDNILRKVGVRQKEVLKTFLEDKTIDIVYLDVEFLEKYWVHASKFQLKTADLMVSLVAFYHNNALVSWDKKLIKGTRDFCRSQSPKEFLES